MAAAELATLPLSEYASAVSAPAVPAKVPLRWLVMLLERDEKEKVRPTCRGGGQGQVAIVALQPRRCLVVLRSRPASPSCVGAAAAARRGTLMHVPA